jgi:hypothetical protein
MFNKSLKAENARLRAALERARADLINDQGDYHAYAMEITNPEHPYHENLKAMNVALGRDPLDVE